MKNPTSSTYKEEGGAHESSRQTLASKPETWSYTRTGLWLPCACACLDTQHTWEPFCGMFSDSRTHVITHKQLAQPALNYIKKKKKLYLKGEKFTSDSEVSACDQLACHFSPLWWGRAGAQAEKAAHMEAASKRKRQQRPTCMWYLPAFPSITCLGWPNFLLLGSTS